MSVEKERDREAERETERQTDRQTDRQTELWIDFTSYLAFWYYNFLLRVAF
jgi:hypothetical protein